MKRIFDLILFVIYKITHPFVRLYWRVFQPKTSGTKAMIFHKENILLVKNINGKFWSLPGGRVDNGETPEICIRRELKEELDLNISKADFLLGTYSSNSEGKKDTIYIFVIHTENDYFKKQWELQDAKWFSINQLPADMSPAAMRRLQEYQEGERGIQKGW